MSRRSATTTKVFVGNLPANATTKDLRELFAPYGAIAECDIAIRCGFLHLEDHDLAMKAIEELNNSTFMGVRISVEKGRVKPFGRRNRGGMGAGGGRERPGPYSRDNLGRPPRIGGYGTQSEAGYGVYDDYGYNRGPRYDDYGDSRYGVYSDRRSGDVYGRGGYGNGYSYDDRSYGEVNTGEYDDRRMGMAPTGVGYDDRYGPPSMGGVDNRRSMMDHGMGGQPKVIHQAGYDHHGQTDGYGRRDSMNKSMERPTSAYSTTNTGYGVAPTSSVYPPSVGGVSGGWGASAGDYGDGRTATGMTAAVGYVDTRSGGGVVADPGAYGDNNASSMYASDGGRSAGHHQVAPMGSYTTGAPPTVGYGTSYGMNVSATGYESATGGYGMGRNGSGGVGGGVGVGAGGVGGGSYDASYPPLPQRSYASGGGPASRRDLPPGPPGPRRY